MSKTSDRSGDSSQRMQHSLSMVSVLALTTALMSTAAFAQDQSSSEQASQQAPINEIFVTGSRIQRTGFNSPTPVTILDNQFMEKMGIVNVADIVAQMPQNSNFTSPANVGLGNFNVGATLANLRGLNPFFGTRTLTLLDGHRFVPSTNGGAVDLNLIPTVMVQRTETVTGGASAAYGTDAIAGVVNIILDKEFTGIKTTIDYGQTFRSDGKDFHASAAGGFDFAGENGHLLIGGEYENSHAIGDCYTAREWCAQSYGVFTNSGFAAGNGQPNFIIGPNAISTNTSRSGVLAAVFGPPFANPQQISSDGLSLVDYQTGLYVSANPFAPQQGGDGDSPYIGVTIRPPVERYSGLGRVDYDITDSVKAYAELSYGQSTTTNTQGGLGPFFTPITLDNPYIPTNVFNALVANFDGGFLFNRNIYDLARLQNHSVNKTWRGEIGFSGDLVGSWSWDAYYQYGHNHLRQRLANDQIQFHLAYAVDAVTDPATGDPACRALVADATVNPYFAANGVVDPNAAGCAPLNVFSNDWASQAGFQYAYGTLAEDFVYTQNVAAGNIHGDIFEGWGAGPIKGAAGIEFRSGKVNDFHGDDGFEQENWLLSWGRDWRATQSVIEGYAEMDVPIVMDAPFAKYVDVDLAIRQTRNKTTDKLNGTGSNSYSFTTWKASAIYDVVEGVRIRGSRSRDTRAASVRELFAKVVATPPSFFATANNVWSGNSADPALVTSGGNSQLLPEKADTTTIGAVIGPFANLRFSADWYEVKIKDAINAGPGSLEITTDCKNFGDYCDRITFETGFAPGEVADSLVNIAAINLAGINSQLFKTRGVDFEADYTLPLDTFGLKTDGSLNFRVLASYLYDMIVQSQNGTPVHWDGMSGPTAAFGSFNTAPHWLGNATLTYTNVGFTSALQARYTGHGRYNALYTGPDQPGYNPTLPNSINDNTVPSRIYFNLSASYDIAFGKDNHAFTLWGVINNMFDKDPPVAPGGNGYPTNPVYFDTYGAAFRMGVRMRY